MLSEEVLNVIKVVSSSPPPARAMLPPEAFDVCECAARAALPIRREQRRIRMIYSRTHHILNTNV